MKVNRGLSCVVIVFISLCMAAIGILFLSNMLSRQVQNIYGSPNRDLSLRQRKTLEIILLINQNKLTHPNELGIPDQSFLISSGESTPSILGRLWEDNIISDPAALRAYMQYAGLDTGIQAGEYSLNASMTPIEIAWALQDATPKSVDFHILPGWRLEEIAAALPTSGLDINPEQFINSANEPSVNNSLMTLLPGDRSVEGFLYPDAYEIERTAKAEDLINLFTNRFSEILNPQLLEGFENQGLNLFEAVTLASIVEREAIIDEEKPLIASVFYNRLASGIKLDSDPTVQYALGYDGPRGGWWVNPLTLNDLEIISPYNTYKVFGLPPGPISNPSIASLKAVAFPAQTPYYYFRAACDNSGKHLFAESFEQHLNNACP